MRTGIGYSLAAISIPFIPLMDTDEEVQDIRNEITKRRKRVHFAYKFEDLITAMILLGLGAFVLFVISYLI